MAIFLMLAGRIILGGFFIYNAYKHFVGSKMLAGYAASKKVPMPKLAVIGTGVLMLLGGLSIILGAYVVIGLWILIVCMLGMTFMIHTFWKETDQARMNDQIAFTKNLAIIGALCLLLSLVM